MTVREKSGRRRYIAFRVMGKGELQFGEVINIFRKNISKSIGRKRGLQFRVIFFRQSFGIVRCSHVYREIIVELINSMHFRERKSETLQVSGTLKTMRDWFRENHGILVPGKTSRKQCKKKNGKTGN